MYIKREKEKEFWKYFELDEIIAVIGPRQSGKTTLINHCLDKVENKVIKKVSFDSVFVLGQFEEDIERFIEEYVKGVDVLFIDEVQYSKSSGQKLKYIYDKFKVKIIISGSSATEISIHSMKYLVGRVFVLNLYTLSFKEFLSYRRPSLVKFLGDKSNISSRNLEFESYLKEYLVYGGYPKVVLLEDKELKKAALKNIFDTYLLKEIKEILEYKEHFKIGKLTNLLSLQIGNLVNVSDLASLSGFSREQCTQALSILDKTFIAAQVKPYFTNKFTELVKSTKVYFYDLGLRNIVLDTTDIENLGDLGSLYENFVFCELLRKDVSVKYWRSKSGAEVDFVIESGVNLIPIEVKKKSLKSENLTRSFYSFIEKYDVKRGCLINSGINTSKLVGKTKIDFLYFWNFVEFVQE